ncbi:hypothetical protein [Streptomyces caelestis]|jgi:hypothetical protein|uniref:Uncharacterized protein n=1 Tax=Streptomyces caelestis TaxID=36816 RepID=A0A7W9H639_9ACTN|nr:hypothetical protein [Streptomyces caelestis]MBB5796088.1 hypothetical protein [Streptomyces caelestis]GGW43568.1 hypothetical protein GCM10010320_24770 [Streptomyces caelestis]
MGLDTTGHHLVVAENGSGEVVGNAWNLGLNVFGDDEAAIALYHRNGYDVESMSLRKSVQQAPDSNS